MFEFLKKKHSEVGNKVSGEELAVGGLDELWKTFVITPKTELIFPRDIPDGDAFGVFFGDCHIGNYMALMPPKIVLPEGQIVIASKPQQWLWACWHHFWGVVNDYKKIAKKRVVGVMMGDILHGNKLGRHPEVINNAGLQIQMAVEVLRPIRQFVDKLYAVKGTEFHSGLGGQFEELLATIGGADDIGWDMPLWIGKKLFVCEHKGKAGTLPWTVAGAKTVSEVSIDYAQTGEKVPDYIMRAHCHVSDDTGPAKFPTTRCMITPSWMLADAYAHGKGFSTVIHPVGGIIVDGGWVQHVLYMPKRKEPIHA